MHVPRLYNVLRVRYGDRTATAVFVRLFVCLEFKRRFKHSLGHITAGS